MPLRPSRRPPEHVSRRSFLRRSVASVLAIQSGCLAGLNEILRHERLEHGPETLLSKQELQDLLKKELHLHAAYELHADDTADASADESAVEPVHMLNTAISKISTSGQKAWHQPDRASQEFSSTASHSIQWLTTYQTSQHTPLPEQDKDCNDHAKQACEILFAKNYQAYFVSVWPKQSTDRFDKSWHQFAVLRLSQAEYLIVNNHDLIHWHGSLEAYVQQEQHLADGTELQLIPWVGISPYLQPKYEQPIIKLLLQGVYGTGSNEDAIRIVPTKPEQSRPADTLIAQRERGG